MFRGRVLKRTPVEVAQWVEHQIATLMVTGSTPVTQAALANLRGSRVRECPPRSWRAFGCLAESVVDSTRFGKARVDVVRERDPWINSDAKSSSKFLELHPENLGSSFLFARLAFRTRFGDGFARWGESPEDAHGDQDRDGKHQRTR